MRETSLTPGHGLDTGDWKSVLSGGNKGIGRLSVRLTKRTFFELLIATNNKFYFRHNSAGVTSYIGAGVPDPARVPDISAQYSAWTGRLHPSVRLKTFRPDHENRRCESVVYAPANVDVDAIFPVATCPDRTIKREGMEIVIGHDQSFMPFFTQRSSGPFGIGDIVLCGPLHSNKYFTPLAACFMLSYCLGMLCRYFPTTWIGLARSEMGDAVYPLVTRMFDWIQDMFPAPVWSVAVPATLPVVEKGSR